MLGEKSKARVLFNKSLRILKSPQIRAEAWLDVERLRFASELLPKAKAIRLGLYPALADSLRENWPAKSSEILIGDSSARLLILPASDEYRWLGKFRLGIPLELQLVMHVCVSGEAGIAKVRLKCLLWPDEVHCYDALEARLDQLIHQVRRQYKISLIVKLGIVTLRKSSVAVLVSTSTSMPSFICKKEEFTASSFGAHYGLGRTQALAVLNDFIRTNKLKIVGSGPGRRYMRNVT